MSESTTLSNGNAKGVVADYNSATSQLSEEQYRALCKQVRQHQLSKGLKKRSKPILKPIGDINVKQLATKIQKSPVDWDDLKIGYPFSLDSEGTLIYTKSGKERAICLNTMTSVPVGGAAVYRVFL